MKKKSIIIAAALVATWLVVDTVREFSANETMEYFSSEPRRLLYVAAIAIGGGFAALGFTRLSPRSQGQIRVLAWGAAASTLTTFVGYFVFRMASLSSVSVEIGGWVWFVVALLFFSAIAAYLWFKFCLAWKARASQ